MSKSDYNLEIEQTCLESYLENIAASNEANTNCSELREDEENTNDGRYRNEITGKRVYCCKTSRSLYCSECYKVLIPKELWPTEFIRRQQDASCSSNRQHSQQAFPFDHMDIVLGVKERRTSSTGIQMMAVAKMITESLKSSTREDLSKPEDNFLDEIEHKNISHVEEDNAYEGAKQNDGSKWWEQVKLYDLNRGDTLPSYRASDSKDGGDDGAPIPTNVAEREGTFVLFPQEGKSVPISSVAEKIKKLVVLDIKWTRSFNVQLFSADHHKILVSQPSEGGGGKSYNPLSPLRDVPFVHLEFPPPKSHFWRWHNRGDGMLSTIEAIYYAARETSAALRKQHREREMAKEDITHKSSVTEEHHVEPSGQNDPENYIDILWLFALQRSIIQERSLKEGRPVAFSEEAKEFARTLRKQIPTKGA